MITEIKSWLLIKYFLFNYLKPCTTEAPTMLASSRTHMAWEIANRSPTWIVLSRITINSITKTTQLRTSTCRDSLHHNSRTPMISFNPHTRTIKDICSNNNICNSRSWPCSRRICKSRCSRWRRRMRRIPRNKRNQVDGSAASRIRQLITQARIWFLRNKRPKMNKRRMHSSGMMIWTSITDSLIFMTSSLGVRRSRSRRMGWRLRKSSRNSKIVRHFTNLWSLTIALPTTWTNWDTNPKWDCRTTSHINLNPHNLRLPPEIEHRWNLSRVWATTREALSSWEGQALILILDSGTRWHLTLRSVPP